MPRGNTQADAHPQAHAFLYLLRPHGTAGIEGEQLVVCSDE
jgi:hypothetical protein